MACSKADEVVKTFFESLRFRYQKYLVELLNGREFEKKCKT